MARFFFSFGRAFTVTFPVSPSKIDLFQRKLELRVDESKKSTRGDKNQHLRSGNRIDGTKETGLKVSKKRTKTSTTTEATRKVKEKKEEETTTIKNTHIFIPKRRKATEKVIKDETPLASK